MSPVVVDKDSDSALQGHWTERVGAWMAEGGSQFSRGWNGDYSISPGRRQEGSDSCAMG